MLEVETSFLVVVEVEVQVLVPSYLPVPCRSPGHRFVIVVWQRKESILKWKGRGEEDWGLGAQVIPLERGLPTAAAINIIAGGTGLCHPRRTLGFAIGCGVEEPGWTGRRELERRRGSAGWTERGSIGLGEARGREKGID